MKTAKSNLSVVADILETVIFYHRGQEGQSTYFFNYENNHLHDICLS